MIINTNLNINSLETPIFALSINHSLALFPSQGQSDFPRKDPKAYEEELRAHQEASKRIKEEEARREREEEERLERRV